MRSPRADDERQRSEVLDVRTGSEIEIRSRRAGALFPARWSAGFVLARADRPSPGDDSLGRRNSRDCRLFFPGHPGVFVRETRRQAGGMVAPRRVAALVRVYPPAHEGRLGRVCAAVQPKKTVLHVTSDEEAIESVARYPKLRPR